MDHLYYIILFGYKGTLLLLETVKVLSDSVVSFIKHPLIYDIKHYPKYKHATHFSCDHNVGKSAQENKPKEPVCWLFKEPIYMSVIFMSARGLRPNVILSFSHYDVTAMPTSKSSLSRFGIHQVIAVRCHDCTTKTE